MRKRLKLSREQKKNQQLCAENPIRLSREEYRKEYLRSDHWHNLRAKVINGCKCKVCNKNPATDPHHLRYKNIYDVLPEDLLAVCRKCHDKIHTMICFKFIPETASLTQIHQGLRKFNRKFGLRPEICKKLENQCWNNKLLAFGVIKMKVDSFMSLAGVKFTFPIIQQLMKIADKPHWSKNDTMKKKSKRIEKLNKFLEERDKK